MNRTYTQTKLNAARDGLAAAWVRLAALIVAIVCAFALAAGVPAPSYAADVDADSQAALQQLEKAFADAYEAAQADNGTTADMASSLDATKVSQSSGSVEISDDETPLAASPDVAASADEEEILDEENPLAANPYASPVNDFVWVLLAIIVVVAGYFFFSARRMEKNIQQMRRFVD